MGRILLLLILLPILEIWLLIRVGSAIGAFNLFMYVIVMMILGSGIARNRGRHWMMQIQSEVARGQQPADAALNGLAIALAGILIAIPGLISDFVGLLLLFPGTRHLITRRMKQNFAAKMSSGGVHVFTSTSFGGFGARGAGPSGNPFGTGGPFSTEDQGFGERDVTPKVIDVTPIRKEDKHNDGSDK